MELETLTVKEQSSNEIDNCLKIHGLEEVTLIKVLKKIFSLGKLFLLALKLEPLDVMRKKIEEDEEDELRV